MGTVWTVLAIEMAVVFVAAVVATRWVHRKLASSERRRLTVDERPRPVAATARRETRHPERV